MKHVYVYKNTLLIRDRSVNIIYDVLNISEVDRTNFIKEQCVQSTVRSCFHFKS